MDFCLDCNGTGNGPEGTPCESCCGTGYEEENWETCPEEENWESYPEADDMPAYATDTYHSH